jgi:hypothetical protein
MTRYSWLVRVSLGLALGALSSPASLQAHEKGVLRVAAREVAVGDTLAIAGEKFGRLLRLTLAIEGTAGRWEIATLETDSSGAFRVALPVPEPVTPGGYRLVAIAPDGDRVAGVDLVVNERVVGRAVVSPAGHADHEPSAEPLRLDRARDPLVTGGVLAVAGLALVAGVLLLRRPAASSEQSPES